MLQPPGGDNDGFDASPDETKAAAERAMGSVEEERDTIEASEEWNDDGVGNYERAQAVGHAGPITKLSSSLPCVRFLRLSTSRRSIETRGHDIFIGHTRG